jgi:hypothetical protein
MLVILKASILMLNCIPYILFSKCQIRQCLSDRQSNTYLTDKNISPKW